MSLLSIVLARYGLLKSKFGSNLSCCCRMISKSSSQRANTEAKDSSPRLKLDWLPCPSDTNLVFVGTGSVTPTNTRGTNSVAVRHADGCIWLFDAGEGTQKKLEDAGLLPLKISKIFITHLHGDHVSGLFGVLNKISAAQRPSNNTSLVHVYGPEGIREFIDVYIRLCEAGTIPRLVIHEICKIAVAYTSKSSLHAHETGKYVNRSKFITKCYLHKPEEDKSWYLLSDDAYVTGKGTSSDFWSIVAFPLIHSCACLGYALEEGIDKRRKLVHDDYGKSLIVSNWNSLTSLGISKPFKLLSSMKGLRDCESIHFPDESVISDLQLVEEKTHRRKIVILGDNCGLAQCEDVGDIVKAMSGADVLVTECTISSLLIGEDDEGESGVIPSSMFSKASTEAELVAIQRGHSTPEMAARMANRISSKSLVMNHFGRKYGGGIDGIPMMLKLEELAYSASLLSRHRIATAFDGMHVPVIKLDHKAKECDISNNGDNN